MEELPKLPGNAFPDITRLDFNVPHHFDWYNGYPVVKDVKVGVGKQPLDIDSIAFAFDPESISFDPSMVYGRTRSYLPPIFRPHYVLYDKKSLSFDGTLTQVVDKEIRVRLVKVTYFLEDDTITVLEPPTLNAGFPQGKLVKRGRYTYDESGELLHWKDLNVGINIYLNGMNFHLNSCDKFTREFLTSQGLIVNKDEPCPVDPYTEKRKKMINPQTHITSDVDALKKMLLFEGKVLRFKAMWDDEGREFKDKTQYKIFYYLQDDTIEIHEIRPRNSGREGPSKLMSRRRIPQYPKTIADQIPAYLEATDDDVPVYLGPPDFVVGKTVNIFYRRFFLIDCDDFTRKYYEKYYKIIQQGPINVDEEEKFVPKQTLPPYLGFGSPEDSIQSWYSIVPKPPKKDDIRILINMSKKLRYTAVIDWVHPEDEGRQFVIEYRLTDGHIKITELRLDNSGHKGGEFLKYILVPKVGSDENKPEYMTPNDFILGERLIIFGHRFIITGMDVAVFRYMEANPEKFTEEVVNDARRYLVRQGLLTEDIKDVAEFRSREEIAEPHIAKEGQSIEGYNAFQIPTQPHPLEKTECKVNKAKEETAPLLSE